MRLSIFGKSLRLFWMKWHLQLLSLILSLYTLPMAFAYPPTSALDGSWVKAINIAIENKVIFGSGFIFTYGPLGFLSTRNTYHLSAIPLFLADIFSCICLYYVFRHFLSKYKGWFFIALVAIFYAKGIEYTTILFMLFIIFVTLNFQNNFQKLFEVAACAICGVTVFFIKINYGIISLPILLSLFLLFLFKKKRAFWLFFTISSVCFIAICCCTNINLVNYVRYGLPIISNFPDAMVVAIDADGPAFIDTLVDVVFFTGMIGYYSWKTWKENAWSVTRIYPAVLLCLMFFLMYKNGFTRADGHTTLFFLDIPVMIMFSMWLLDFGNRSAKFICICVLLITDANTALPHACEGNGFVYNATIRPFENYCSTIFKKVNYAVDTAFAIPQNKLRLIGQSPIDIMPVEISLLLQNNLNVDSRPIVQSYSTYSHILDSLNADHFFHSNRPQFVMLWNSSIDNRYAPWDESLTKAMLHLNYDYIDLVSLIKDSTLNNNNIPGNYLLLQSKPGINRYPKFEKLFEKKINLEDTTYINFPDDSAVYMTAEIEYHTLGKIKNILFQPPILSVSLYFDYRCTSGITGRVVRPLLFEPELINKAILGNKDLENFICGNLVKNKSVKAFAFHAAGRGCKKEVKLTFYKFSNY